ncbi:structural maintenance of chromosomes protein 6B-like isoform X2 [Euphorbia lathyris]|uniref:structural maintenance of chromosomes protein 6B-like isoform X2 n=1 Tax=Euphorbia lathyris TaxID=212925 RepID=UPI003313A576
MADPRVSVNYNSDSSRSGAGIITRIRLENFMCHSNLEIELCPWVNFITGQNGSGKSAILTALCVAFGCRAKGTQRASTLKDFIKTGCSYAVVEVEVKNDGHDPFKPETYGDAITIERKISHSTSSTILKDFQGRKVASRREELQELIEHFNIDVENPCVIMSQDKSREFLHSGNDKDKFKFFFKATLLQKVGDLLQNINEQLRSTNALVDELEATIKPIEKELNELQAKIKNLEHLEEITHRGQQLTKMLAWSWVYCVDKQLKDQSLKITKLKDRIPTCQTKIDWELSKMESLADLFTKKKAQVAHMMHKTSEVRKRQGELQHSISMATKRKLEIEEELGRGANYIRKMVRAASLLQQQVQDMQEQHVISTQAEASEIEEKLKELEYIVASSNATLSRLKKEENDLFESVSKRVNELEKITEEIGRYRKKENEVNVAIRQLRQHKSNKVTAFGGEKVIHLLQLIERYHQRFNKPPIGPIGAHLALRDDDRWALAVENALGKLLNAFIVTNHKDSLLLRNCAREARYNNLQIIIYDFSRPRLNIPFNMLPQTNNPTTLSTIQSENDTVLNVLVDMGAAERQVLVEDYDGGKAVAFDKRILNVKEVYTLDGYKMFSRGSVQTVLPPNKKLRTGRLCSSYDEQIKDLEQQASSAERNSEGLRKRKRDVESYMNDLQGELKNAKARRLNAERDLYSKELAVRDMQKSFATESSSSAAPNADELHQEISTIQGQIHEKESFLEKLRVRRNEVEKEAMELKLSFENLCESAKGDLNAFEEAEGELMKIEKDLQAAEAEKAHYERVMTNKVLPDIKAAEAHYRELEEELKENRGKASIICPETDVEALGGLDGRTPEQLSAQLNRVNQRLQHESQRCSESIDDLRMLYEKKQRKILRKQETYKGFREKLKACEEALNLRRNKFLRNSTLLRRQLTWNFNGQLGKKGISGSIKVNYEEKTLGVEVRMPQDASSSTVRDTRGLSGGERSFSTLCFALALHEMTESPFRAMDEFDVFMDAVSRKISLDTVVDFALEQGSQWIFITPHDISMVKQGERIKKQQMAAPRS